MKKIAFISGGYGPLSPEMERRQKILKAVTTPGHQIEFYGGKGSIESRKGVYEGTGKFGSIESEYELSYVFPHEAKLVVEAEEEGYDAVILACGGDPGLFGLYEAVSIPVIGPGTSARHICSLISHKFTLLTIGKDGPIKKVFEHERPKNLGRWVSTRSIGMGVLDVRDYPDRAFNATLREAKLAMKEDGADAFTYGCMSMSFLDMDKRLEAELNVPFVNPVKIAVRIAEMYIDLGIKHSKITFPTPSNYGFK